MKQPHICLDETLGVRYAVLPGDPARLDRVAAQLENVRELAYNREFRSLTGTYRGVPVLAISTAAISKQDGAALLHADPRLAREAFDRVAALLPLAQALGCPLCMGKVRGQLSDGGPAF